MYVKANSTANLLDFMTDSNFQEWMNFGKTHEGRDVIGLLMKGKS